MRTGFSISFFSYMFSIFHIKYFAKHKCFLVFSKNTVLLKNFKHVAYNFAAEFNRNLIIIIISIFMCIISCEICLS